MKENKFKPIAKNLLKELGLEVHDISSKNSKTPDFDVKGGNSRYTIELKIKGDDPDEIKQDSETLTRGEIVNKEIPIGPRNRLYAIIKEGIKQMTEHDPKNKTFHVLWMHSTGRNAKLLNMRFHATLFGTQDLFSVRQKNLITCYYFNESAFYSWRTSLDGAILTYHNKAQLCVNTLSPRLREFQKSDLYKTLSQGLCDPGIFQISEGVMVADCNMDRKDANKIIAYLREKYKLDHLQTINMKQHSVTMAIPKK